MKFVLCNEGIHITCPVPEIGAVVQGCLEHFDSIMVGYWASGQALCHVSQWFKNWKQVRLPHLNIRHTHYAVADRAHGLASNSIRGA